MLVYNITSFFIWRIFLLDVWDSSLWSKQWSFFLHNLREIKETYQNSRILITSITAPSRYQAKEKEERVI